MTEVDYPTPIESLSTRVSKNPSPNGNECSHSEATERGMSEGLEHNGSKLMCEDKTSTEVASVNPSSPPPPPVKNPWNKKNPHAKVSTEEGISFWMCRNFGSSQYLIRLLVFVVKPETQQQNEDKDEQDLKKVHSRS